jgi:hypothetical protein
MQDLKEWYACDMQVLCKCCANVVQALRYGILCYGMECYENAVPAPCGMLRFAKQWQTRTCYQVPLFGFRGLGGCLLVAVRLRLALLGLHQLSNLI